MNEKFWMLYVEDGGKPNQPYLTYEGALARAKALAQQTGSRVFMLEASQVVTAEAIEVEVTYCIAEV